MPCVFFEINNNINKIFALSQNDKMVEIKYVFYNDKDSDRNSKNFFRDAKI